MKIYICWQIDHFEGILHAAFLTSNVSEMRSLTQTLQRASGLVKSWAQSSGGTGILDLTALGAVEVPADKMAELPDVRARFQQLVDATISIGVGMELSEAYTAVRVASLRGGDQIALYVPEMEEELKSSQDADVFGFLGKSDDTTQSPPDQAPPPEPNKQDGQGDGQMSDPRAQAAPPPPQNDGSGSAGSAPMMQPQGEDGDDDGGGNVQQQDPRAAITQALRDLKQNSDAIERLKETNPQAFQAVIETVQAMILMAQGMMNEEGGDAKKSEEEDDSLSKALPTVAPSIPPLAPPKQPATLPTVAPSIPPVTAPTMEGPKLHDTVDGFMQGLKTIPKGTPARGKFITQHMNHGPFLSALGQHPQGKEIHSMLTQHLNSTANAGFKAGATQATVKSEEGGDFLDEETPGEDHPPEESSSWMDCDTNPHKWGEDGAGEYCVNCGGDRGILETMPEEMAKQSKLPNPPSTPVKPHHDYPIGHVKEGKVKVGHIDPDTNEPSGTSWNSVRSGMIQSKDGHPISSRNPNGK